MPTLQGEQVARAIRQHQLEESNLWKYRDLVAELHTWVDRFHKDFELNVPTPIIAITPLRRNILATYRLGRNEIGARTTITFNERWIPLRPLADTLVTLIHELVHAYEEWHLGREKGGFYHTKAWREKMEEIGIIADDHGVAQTVLRIFIDYLQLYGVPDIQFRRSREKAPAKRRQMQKWICGCSSERPARAVLLNARCEDCGQKYRKVDS